MAYSNQLNTAYRSSDTVTEADFSHLISVFLCFLSSEPILLIVYPLFQLFKTLSLDESRSPEYNLFSDLEENSEEEVAETMEQYMSKTRADYGSGIEDLKTKFLSKYCPPARTAKKIEEINNFQQEPDETLYQAWERFKELLMKCPQHYLTEMQEVILFYNGLDVPTRQILDSKGVIPTKTAADAKVAIQEMAEYSQKWHNGTSRTRSTKTSDGLAAIQAQLNNLGREIKKVNEKVYAAQVGCEQCKGPHYTKDYPLKEEGKTLEEAYYTQFGAPFQQGGQYRAAALGFYQRNNANPSYQERRQSMEESLSKFMSESAKRHEENSNLIKEIRASTDAAIRNQGASIKTLEIQIGVYMFGLRERMELDLEARLMGETLVLNRSLDPLYGDYIELNDLNVPLELRRDQVDDLMPTIEEGEVIDEPMINIIKTRNNESLDEYPSFCDFDQKIHIDCAYNLRFSCMIVLENMDGYRDQDMGDIILGEPFCEASCVEAR
ncbi:putative reverse transcriptase domain-containing protein, partial [Tanacetum coccineum]